MSFVEILPREEISSRGRGLFDTIPHSGFSDVALLHPPFS